MTIEMPSWKTCEKIKTKTIMFFGIFIISTDGMTGHASRSQNCQD